MVKRALLFAAAATAILFAVQQPDITGRVSKLGQVPALAVPDFRATGDAQPLVAAFNETLWSDIKDSGLIKLVPKTLYPTVVPQQPSDLLQPKPGLDKAGGRLMSDWSSPPTQANYLAFGYAASKDGLFVAFGYFYDLSQPTVQRAKVLGGLPYTAPLNEAGAREAAHRFADDILKLFGGASLFGTHIYFASDRTGHKEIWAMDYDGSNQRRITHFNNIATSPAISPDGSRLMCTAFAGPDKPARLYMYSTDPLLQLAFANPAGSYDAHSSFTADGKQVLFDGAVNESYRIYMSDLGGSHLRVVHASQDVMVQPVMNPKNSNLIAFTSDRGGTPQIYVMDANGGSISRVTSGVGEAHNPAWSLDGGFLAFAWSQGYAPGKLNIFVADVANPTKYQQLTHGEDKNENPSWAPDGRHIAFSSSRTGKDQIWTMLADGTDLKQLTTDGANTNPAWGK